VFHGTDGCSSVLELFIGAREPCTACFDEVPLENNREGNENRGGSGGMMLELKEIFHCDPSSRHIFGQRGFTKEALAIGRGSKASSGRILMAEKALSTAANYRKAVAHLQEFCDEDPDFNLPSGKELEDALSFCQRTDVCPPAGIHRRQAQGAFLPAMCQRHAR